MRNAILKQNPQANGLMQKAVEHAEAFCCRMQEAKAHAATAGWFLLQARAMVGDGGWLDYLACFASQISRGSAYRYMQFAEEVMQWAADDRPAITSPTDKLNHGIEIAMASPRTFTQILRESRLMRRFGEYDPERYEAKKLSGGGDRQLEFRLERFATGLRQLVTLPELPADTDLDDLERDLEAALAHVRTLKSGTSGRTLDV